MDEYNPLILPEEYYIGLGKIISAAAQAESIVQHAIGGLLGCNAFQADATTAHMSMPQRFDILMSLAPMKFDDVIKLQQLNRVVANLRTSFKKRNEYAHNIWCQKYGTDETDVYLEKTTSRGWLKRDVKKVKAQDLQKAATEIYEAGMELYKFLANNDLLPDVPSDFKLTPYKVKN